MVKKIIVSICLLFSLASFAQQSTASPYSYYGIGDVRFKGSIENRSMGGMAVVADSTHINVMNPASFSSLKLTTFSVGGTFAASKLRTNTQNEKAQRTTLDYLAIGIPIKKLGIGFGLIPYSAVGYSIRNTTYPSGIKSINYYSGDGGMNKVFIGFGYQLTKQLSFGTDLQYNFGKIDTKNVAVMYDAFDTQIQYGTREANSSNISGVNFNTGLTFNSKISKKVSIFSSATYSPQSTLNLQNSRRIAAVQSVSGANEVVVGDDLEINVANTKLKLPSKFTFGLGIGDAKKWIIGSEVVFQGTSNFGNRFNDINNVAYENAARYTFGGYYTPNYKSFSNYFERVTYRSGFRYENTGLVIDNQSIKDNAFTLGLGLPLRGTFSNINIGFELGSRGTKNSGLVKENYMNFSVGLSFNDRWFQKRKFD
jgi:hypothetical protein